MALNTGLSQEEVDLVATHGPVQGLSPEYALGCTAGDELVTGGTLSNEISSSLLDRYGEVGARRLILATGYFALLAMFLNACRVPLEPSDKIGTSISPLG